MNSILALPALSRPVVHRADEIRNAQVFRNGKVFTRVKLTAE
jgi:hypothetical protein